MMQTSGEFIELKDIDQFWGNLDDHWREQFAEFFKKEVMFNVGFEWKQYTFQYNGVSASFWAKRSTHPITPEEKQYTFSDFNVTPQVETAEESIEDKRGIQPDRWRGKKKGKARKCWQR